MTFQLGHTYRNRKGEYTVLRLEGQNMIIRYGDGRLVRVPIDVQARIWARIQEEEEFGAEDVDIDAGPESESRKTDDVRDLVARVLHTLPQPWPPDITDQVCLAIERRAEWLAEYKGLVKELGVWTMNTSLGAHVKDLTNMENSGHMATSKSHLIASYSVLATRQR
jgi:hypothetical protein